MEKNQLDENEVNLLLKIQCPTHSNNECQTQTKPSSTCNSPSAHQSESTIESSNNSSNETKRENSPIILGESDSYTDIMMKRWQKHIDRQLNKIDNQDAHKVNKESGQAEFAQVNYLMLR